MARNKEAQEIVDSLFPVGKERWFRLKVVDQDKAIKTLWMPMDSERAKPYVEECGFEVTAIGVRDEYTPQISAIMDLKAEVVGVLYDRVDDYILESINAMFKAKMDELRKHTITTEIPNPQ